MSISPGDSVMEGKKATLSCDGDANPPVSQYFWFDPNDQDLHFSGQKLTLEPLRVQHSGSYRCRGTNQIGSGDSLPSILTVYCKFSLPSSLGSFLCPGSPFPSLLLCPAQPRIPCAHQQLLNGKSACPAPQARFPPSLHVCISLTLNG